jgi:uncharacterized membrane protein YheB (UPF0754 family)
MNIFFLLIPIGAAIIGWLIHYAVIAVIFHPNRGLLSKKMQSIATSLGRYARQELIESDLIRKKISDPSNLDKVMPTIETHVDDFLSNKLTKEMPFLSMFIGNKTLDSVKKVFMQEITLMFPQLMEKFAANIEDEFDPEKIINEKFTQIGQKDLSNMIRKKLSREIKVFLLLGAFTGLIAGLVAIICSWLIFH